MKLIAVLLLIVSCACTRNIDKSQIVASGEAVNSVRIEAMSLGTSIRAFDFCNFAYTYHSEEESSTGQLIEKSQPFVLRHGVSQGKGDAVGFELVSLQYGDVTQDNNEEAILTLMVDSGGRSTSYLLLVYGTTGTGVRLLWEYETGDRGDRGLRNIYVQDQSLVLEVYQPSRTPEGNVYGLASASAFTRSYYQGRGEHLALLKVETLSNDMLNEAPHILLNIPLDLCQSQG